MGPYRAIFFDRDGTLSRNDPRKEAERDRAIGDIIGDASFRLTDEAKMDVFWRVMNEPAIAPVVTLAGEVAFWRRWYQLILRDHGVGGDTKALAADLCERFCFHKMMELFPETVGVLNRLRATGYRLGVISDTFPSLEESLKALGIASYFDSFTASSLVGAGKPDARIFNAALESLGVHAGESVFVDDCKEEARGARQQGFTAFHLDRARGEADCANWTFGNLEHLVDFLKAKDS